MSTPDPSEQAQLVKWAYQEARAYVKAGFPKGLKAYGSFREYCNRARIDHQQVLAEVRRAEWDKVWNKTATTS
jgi:hypothetical protein